MNGWKISGWTITVTAVFCIVWLSAVSCKDNGVTASNIVIRQGTSDISSGSYEYVFAEGTLIDGAGGAVSDEVIFTIENIGGSDLSITGVILSSGDTDNFVLDLGAFTDVIAPLGTTKFSLAFDPVTLSMKTVEISITSDDEDKPTFTFTAMGWGMKQLTAEDGSESDYFGTSVALSGNIIAVGAPGATAAYIFYRNEGGTDNWGQVKKLTGLDGFGLAVALSGDVLAVGAEYSDRVYIYHQNEGGADNWGVAQWWSVLDSDFGSSVAVSGDTIVAGSPRATVGGDYAAGSARVFYRDQDGPDMWGHVKTLSLTPTGVQDFFGYSVAVSGTTAIVGRPIPVPADGGSVYVYYRDHDTPDNWGEFKKLTASDSDGYSGAFGEGIILSGDLAVISRPYDDLGSTGDYGSVYILNRNAGGTDNWGEVKKLISSEGNEYENFGRSFALSGDTLAIGGADFVYLFKQDEGGTNNWGEVNKIAFESCEPLALSGDTMAAGDAYADVGTQVSQGAIYIWEP